MRIAFSGTHFIGKTTLIDDFIKIYPNYKCETEAYYKLQGEKETGWSLEPSLDSLMYQLEHSIEQLNKYKDEPNIIFEQFVSLVA